MASIWAKKKGKPSRWCKSESPSNRCFVVVVVCSQFFYMAIGVHKRVDSGDGVEGLEPVTLARYAPSSRWVPDFIGCRRFAGVFLLYQSSE